MTVQATRAQVVCVAPNEDEWYVTEVTFVSGDHLYKKWIDQPTPKKGVLLPDDHRVPNVWVIYKNEEGQTEELRLRLMQFGEVLAWLQSINALTYSEGLGNRRGARANFELQRKTWKQHQGKVSVRRPMEKPPAPEERPPPRGVLFPTKRQVENSEIPFDLTTPEGRAAFKASRGLT